jgi:hypothetical protein
MVIIKITDQIPYRLNFWLNWLVEILMRQKGKSL